MKKLLPFVLLVLGIGVGAAAGTFLGTEKTCEAPPCVEEEAHAKDDGKDAGKDGDHGHEPNYLSMKNQFVVPVVRDGRVGSLVVMSLSLEAVTGTEEAIYKKEPKLRDGFLRVLFDHAHTGGFDGSFTESGQLTPLRIALLESAQSVVGKDITDILITDIVRQEM